jgi:ankyrin repeat protein
MSHFDSAHPYRSLPHSPDLGHLRDEAKTLKALCASHDSAALAFVATHLNPPLGIVKLADAQFTLARAYGFKSWARLKAFVEAQSRSPAERGGLLLQTLFTDNHSLLQELYQRRESLPSSDFFLAAAVGNIERVESLLASDATWATQVGGPMKTQAITYASHARFGQIDASYAARQHRVVALLFSYGADPNAYVQEASRGKDGNGRLSALYGCCRQPGNPIIAKLLLDAGASTDDGESLYHASELSDPRCLELLFAAGVSVSTREFCIRRALDSENPAALSIYLENGTDPNHLDWALFRHRSLNIIELLVEHGADVNRPAENFWVLERIQGLAPVQIAERDGRNDIVAYLLARGAADKRSAVDRLIGACARGDEEAVGDILSRYPDVVATLTQREHSNIASLARDGRLRTVQLMLDAGFDIEAKADDLDATALHYAASKGDVAMTGLLLSRGARRDIRNKYGGTPFSTALHSAAHFPDKDGRYAEVIQLLLDAGDIASDDNLRFAVENDLDDIADILKARGATL